MKNGFVDLQSKLHADMFFQTSEEQEEVFHQEDLIQLEPYGVSVVPDANRPFLIMKDKSGQFTLPVFLSPIEAGVALTQSNKSIAPVTPHAFAMQLMKSLEIKVLQCVFVQIKGPHQYVRLYLQGHPSMNSIKLRAEEVMSLALQLAVPIYATKAFINKSKLLTAHIEGVSPRQIRQNKRLQKHQPYIQ